MKNLKHSHYLSINKQFYLFQLVKLKTETFLTKKYRRQQIVERCHNFHFSTKAELNSHVFPWQNCPLKCVIILSFLFLLLVQRGLNSLIPCHEPGVHVSISFYWFFSSSKYLLAVSSETLLVLKISENRHCRVLRSGYPPSKKKILKIVLL